MLTHCRAGYASLAATAPARLKPERRDVAPAEEAARDLRLVDGAGLVARVAGIGGDERGLRVEHLHQVADHPVRIDRRVVRLHQRPELRQELLLAGADLLDHLRPLARPPARRQLAGEGRERQLGVADHGVARLVAPVDVERVDRALHDRLLVGVGDGVAEAVGEEARADREEQVGLAEEVLGQRAAHAHRQRMVLREGALGLERRQHRHLRQLRELHAARPSRRRRGRPRPRRAADPSRPAAPGRPFARRPDRDRIAIPSPARRDARPRRTRRDRAGR